MRLHSFFALGLCASLAPAASAQQTLHTLFGGGLGGQLGAAVAGDGDVDNDGISDVIMGAPADSTTGTSVGRVRVVSSSGGFALLDIFGAAPGDQFGAAVAFVGDVNVDDHDDFAVGAPGVDTAAGANAGRVRVFSGKTGAVLVIHDGEAAGDRFGQSLGTLPGITNGFSVGAPFVNGPGGSDVGAVYLYAGVQPLHFTKVLGTWPGERFGWSLASSLVNGTSTPNVVVGAPGYDQFLANQGRVRLFHPFTGAFGASHLGAASSELGTSVVRFGDVDHDGHGEYAAGAPGAGAGHVRIYSGATGAIVHQVNGPSAGARFGQALASGLHAIPGPAIVFQFYLAVGAPLSDLNGTDAGRVHFFRVESAQVTEEWTKLANTGHKFGSALSISPYPALFKGVFLHRVVAGEPGEDGGGTDSGGVRVMDETDGGSILSMPGHALGEMLGYAVCAVGDVNGDGAPDYAAGAPRAWKFAGIGSVLSDVGEARIHSGANGAPLKSLAGGAEGDRLGAALAGAGDVDGDGIPDLLVGAPASDTAALTDAGEAFVQSSATGALLFTIGGFQANSEFGDAVAAGDLNNDGKPDFAVGIPRYDVGPSADVGRVRVYSGVNGSTLLLDRSGSAGDRLGDAVAMGDVDGDGFADLIAGAPMDESSLADQGRVNAYSGATGALLWSAVGTAANDGLGLTVAVVGDVNGDGMLDVAAGAPFATVGGAPRAGYVRVMHGAIGFTHWTATGVADDVLGASVAGAGDVDLDGRAEVLVGAHQFPFLVGTIGDGFVRLYRSSGQLIHATPSPEIQCGFGHAVAGIGDASGDGVPDAVIGAPFRGPNFPTTWQGGVSCVSMRPAGVSFYGASTPGCDGPQLATANGIPKVGSLTFGFASDRAPANALGLGLVGNAQDLGGSDLFGIGLHVDLAASSFLTSLDVLSDGAGFGFAAAPIPGNPGLAGVSLHFQSIWVWGGACPLPGLGLSATSAVTIAIQP